MPMTDLSKLLKLYDCCEITPMELLIGLVQAAVESPPEQIIPLLSPESLQKLQEASKNPPTTPDKQLFCDISCHGPGFDWEAWQREQQRLWYDGVWRWHHYFHRAKERPES